MRILMIVEPDRTDWYDYLKSDTHNEYLLLWHENAAEIPPDLPGKGFFQSVYHWSAFLTPRQLLRKIRPDRIIFFEIIDQRQIALLVAANKEGIKTFYLEHGAAGDREAAIRRANEKNYFKETKLHYLLNRFKNGFSSLLKTKIFYYSASFKLSSLRSLARYLRLPVSMLFDTPNKALAQCIFPERTPSLAIVFNKPNFEQFQVYTGIPESKAVFTGVPLFDHFFSERRAEQSHITFIEHPYLEFGMLGWNPEFHRKVAQTLYDFAVKRNLKILVKLHPRSDMSRWQQYGFRPEFLEIVQIGDFTDRMLESRLILAYSSSLVNGFLCAQKNVVLLGWHPDPGIFGADFSKTGLCHVSLHPEELETNFDYWVNHNRATGRKQEYEQFLERFNFPFDGKAAERVMDAITDQ